ncbi:DUF397 domain-containing protein [Streptomyces griseoviridis]
MTTDECTRWFKSSYSGNGGSCVEIAADLATDHGVVPVRDTKVADSPILTFRTDVFAAFLTSLKDTP